MPRNDSEQEQREQIGNMDCGVVEGFFGKPWDWASRQVLVDFLGDCGYQFYIYAPKADPYLRRRWREPMPEATIQELETLSSRCRQSGASLGIGLTPFEIYLNFDGNARAALRAKVQELNSIHADIICVLFDDMRGDIENLAALQAEVVAEVCAWSNAGRFIICPTYYSCDPRLAHEFGPAPKTYLRDLGKALDSRIDIFWTGEQVISDRYSVQHLTDVASELRRKPFIWDNRISNDSKSRCTRLFLNPSSSAWDPPNDWISGFAINPMNQPNLSRIALCRYMRLLGPPAGSSTSPDSCLNLVSAQCARLLSSDQDSFQFHGLGLLDDVTRNALIQAYEAVRTDQCAQEVAAWIRGDYAFDPQCLTS